MNSIKELRTIQVAMHSILGMANLDIPLSSLIIAGGAARDVACGSTPKDYDIYILNQGWDEEQTFHKAGELSRRARGCGMKTAVFQAYGHASGEDLTNRDFDDNILTGLQLTLKAGGYAVPEGRVYDILFSRHETIEDVLDSFDCNWSQQYVAALPIYLEFLWEGKRELEFTGKPMRRYREKYIRDKYAEAYP